MEWLLQIDRNKSTGNSGILLAAVIVVAIVIICVTAYQAMDYRDAVRQFNIDPSSENKQRLIRATRHRGDQGKSQMEVLSMIEAQNDAEKVRRPKGKGFVSDLEVLAELHEKGTLSDDEFENAKARILN